LVAAIQIKKIYPYSQCRIVKVGVIGFQGDVTEHMEILYKLKDERKRDIEPVLVKSRRMLSEVSALVLPGGESTTIYKLIKEYDIYWDIIRRAKNGMPVMGTCAGLILVSRNAKDERVRGMDLIDITIRRNAYGRQANSFYENIKVKSIGNIIAIFIRAPIIESVGDAEVMAMYDNQPIMVRNQYVLGMTFHPELSGDTRIHDYFLSMVGREGYTSTGKREWYVSDIA